MSGDKSRVSVAIPVYNGDNYLAEALDSILAQTYTDFEIVISDNGSTDATESICRRYMAQDSRVKYFRTAVNQGASWNFRRAVALASGFYFVFLAHDDKWAPEFLEKCVAVLDAQPEVILCYPKAIEIDTQGNVLYKKEQFLDAASPRPHLRFRQMIRMDHNCETLFGLTRREVLAKTSIHADFPDGDRVMLGELSLYGTYYRVPEYLFFHREHPVRSLNIYPSRFDRLALLKPTKGNQIAFPHFEEFFAYLRGISHIPLGVGERLACYGEMLRWLKDNRKRLRGDVVYVTKYLLKWALRMQPRPGEAH
jgi:glycosyltransferase involved in cell wall biosynthesis